MSRTVPSLVIVVIVLVLGLGGCGGQAQIGEDKEAFKAVDALYTAVSLRDPKLLDQCAASLTSLHEAGKLPDAAQKSLDAIITEARSEKWEPAQERLAKFMEGQRR